MAWRGCIQTAAIYFRGDFMTAYFGGTALANLTTIVGPIAVATNTYSYNITYQCQLLWLHLIYVSDATVGTRIVHIQHLDGSSNTLCESHSAYSHPASTTTHYECFQGTYRETTPAGGSIQLPIATSWIMRPGDVLRIGDYAPAPISAGDSMIPSFGLSP